MKKEVYLCDFCKKEIQLGTKHVIYIGCSPYPEDDCVVIYKNKKRHFFSEIGFCNSDCASKFFIKL